MLVLDADATGTVPAMTTGILVGVIDPELDPVAIYSTMWASSTLMTTMVKPPAHWTVKRDGTFTFLPADRLQRRRDVLRPGDRCANPLAPGDRAVNSTPLRVTINVTPVNDPPVATNPPVLVEVRRSTRTEDDLLGQPTDRSVLHPGLSANESDQVMVIDTVGEFRASRFTTELGGTLFIAADGRSVTVHAAD